jgi:hypothetical protein
VDWCYSASRGAFSGILLMWDWRIVEKIEECVGEFTVSCSSRDIEDDFAWAFAGVYEPNFDTIRSLWQELAGLIS